VILPASYQIVLVNTAAVVSTEPAGATATIIGGLPLGQQVTFVVVALEANGTPHTSAESNPVSAFGRPGGPAVSLQLVARTPSSVTIDVFVDVLSHGGSTVGSYDVTLSGSGRTLGTALGVPIAQRPYRIIGTCVNDAELCLSGGDVTATATLYNQAGAGPPASTTNNVPAPPGFDVNQNVPVMVVSAGGKCLHRSGSSVHLLTCNGSAEQQWRPRNLGDFLSGVDGACLEHERGSVLGFTRAGDDECKNREDRVRWVHLQISGNTRHFRAEGRSTCIAVLGDVSSDFTPVNLGTCSFDNQTRWYMYKQQPGVPMAALQPAAVVSTEDSAGPGSPESPETLVLFLVPLVAGLIQWGRRRHRRAVP